MGLLKKIDLLELKENDVIWICSSRYEVLNRIRYTEKGGYWVEYKLKDEQGKAFYLNVEEELKILLYEVLEIRSIELEMKIVYNNCEYELFEKGNGTVDTYSGITDVALGDKVEYYEYTNVKDKKEVLSIEKWKHETEISLGHVVESKYIK